MGIKVTTGAKAVPAVVYDRVHVTNLMITQPVFEDDSQIPGYTIEVHYRLYGVVGEVRYYSSDPVQVIHLPNFIAIAMAAAEEGDASLLTALSSLETAVASILKQQTGMEAQQS